MTRRSIKSGLAWSLTINLYIAIQLIWELLEIWSYGSVTPRIVDTVIGFIIMMIIRVLMLFIVDKIEEKYMGCVVEEVKEKRKLNAKV